MLHHLCGSALCGVNFVPSRRLGFPLDCLVFSKQSHLKSLPSPSISSLLPKRFGAACCQSSPPPPQVHQPSLRKDDIPVHGLSETIVGVLGGGQLGRMLCQAASKMAVKIVVLDPMANCPASTLAHNHIIASFDDSATVQEFAKRCGVLTFEIEHVDVATLEKLEQQGVQCEPRASTIRIIQDKYIQKLHFSDHGIPLPEFMQIDDISGAKRAGDLFGYPLMVKSRRLAYDGRGNAVAKSQEELPAAVAALGGYDRGLYIEKWAPFVKVDI